MKNTFKQGWAQVPSKGGLIGAMVGTLASLLYHHKEDHPLKNAGKTSLFSGAGFLAGHWLEKVLRKR